MSDPDPAQPFFLTITDHDRGVFAVEGPMTDDRPWAEAAAYARSRQRHIACGPARALRDELTADYRRAHNLPGVPPGSILRPRPRSAQLPAEIAPAAEFHRLADVPPEVE